MEIKLIMRQTTGHTSSIYFTVLSLLPSSPLPGVPAEYSGHGVLGMDQDSILGLFLTYCKKLVQIILYLSGLVAWCEKWELGCHYIWLFAVRIKIRYGNVKHLAQYLAQGRCLVNARFSLSRQLSSLLHH